VLTNDGRGPPVRAQDPHSRRPGITQAVDPPRTDNGCHDVSVAVSAGSAAPWRTAGPAPPPSREDEQAGTVC
jgi:hypothetical protein